MLVNAFRFVAPAQVVGAPQDDDPIVRLRFDGLACAPEASQETRRHQVARKAIDVDGDGARSKRRLQVIAQGVAVGKGGDAEVTVAGGEGVAETEDSEGCGLGHGKELCQSLDLTFSTV